MKQIDNDYTITTLCRLSSHHVCNRNISKQRDMRQNVGKIATHIEFKGIAQQNSFEI